jgi:stress-induced morphogen
VKSALVKRTRETKAIEKLMTEHFPNHARAFPPAAYRYNPASIRVRVVDEQFKDKSLTERERMVLPILEKLPEETQADIMILLLLSPDEMNGTMMSHEFDHPTPPANRARR